MDWTVPAVERVSPPYVADERAMLDARLDYQRATLLTKCAGLNSEQLRRRSAQPSALSLLGLVRHMTEVERWWFRRNVAGEAVGDVHCTEASPDADFEARDTADAQADLAAYLAECDLARRAVAGRSLDETFRHPRRGTEMSLRWVYLHMIEEYARHNGHADLLRERIDGATGE